MSPVDLDDGTLVVEPPTPGQQPTLSQSQAATEIWASSTLLGHHAGPLGYGIVTITLHQQGIPTVTSLPAWVGFAVGASASCPMETVPTGPTTTLPALPSSGYAAIVIGAANGSPAVAYTARTSICGFAPSGPSVSPTDEVVSIPWVATGQVKAGQLSVQATLPPCGTFEGSSVSGSAQSMTVTLAVEVPDIPLHCPAVQPLNESVQVGSPNSPGAPPSLVSPSTVIEHGDLGPIHTVS